MLIFDNVSKRFSDNSQGLSEISFSVEPGELVFITGNSGSGKTTLMRLMTKDYLPTEGEIQLEDMQLSQVKSSDIHTLRRKVGVVFQDYKLLSDLNVWENISMPLYIIGTPQAEVEQRVTDLLRLVGLADKAALFPSQLSGGEAQRVSIARALTTGPAVIFADEPTGNLDPETGLAIASLLHKINTLGTTLLFATHNLDFIKRFKNSRHIHLENGRVVLDTKHSVTGKQKSGSRNQEPESSNLESETGKHKTKNVAKTETKAETDTKTNTKTNTNTKAETNDKTKAKTSSEDEFESEGEQIKSELKKEKKQGFLSRIFGKKSPSVTSNLITKGQLESESRNSFDLAQDKSFNAIQDKQETEKRESEE